MELVDYSSSIYSIIPALLAIILAIATRRVLVSLSAGIIVGALMLVDFNPLNALIYLKDNVVALVYSSEEGMNSNMNIVFFLVLLGVLTALLTVFKALEQPIIGRVEKGKIWLDLRSVADFKALLDTVENYDHSNIRHVDHGKTALLKALTGTNTAHLPEEKKTWHDH